MGRGGGGGNGEQDGGLGEGEKRLKEKQKKWTIVSLRGLSGRSSCQRLVLSCVLPPDIISIDVESKYVKFLMCGWTIGRTMITQRD